MAEEEARNASRNQGFLRGILDRLQGTERQTRLSKLTGQTSNKRPVSDSMQGKFADAEHSKVIQSTAELLDEAKDILEELTILRVLLTQQEDVWKRLVSQEVQDNKTHGPGVIINELSEMINRSNSIHKSVSTGFCHIELN